LKSYETSRIKLVAILRNGILRISALKTRKENLNAETAEIAEGMVEGASWTENLSGK